MEVRYFPSKAVKPIAVFYDYFTEAKGKRPDRIVITRKQFETLEKAAPVAAKLGRTDASGGGARI